MSNWNELLSVTMPTQAQIRRAGRRAVEVAGNIFLVAAIVVAVVSIVYFGIVV